MSILQTRGVDLSRLNSATKYPSIPTYHRLGDRGALLDEHDDLASRDLIYTEKVDGTNSRIILMPDGCYLLGSREELLFARGDLVHNPALGIVDALRDLAEKLVVRSTTQITVVYLETYGGKITAASKNYSGQGQVAYRLFDVCRIPPTVLEQDSSLISSWREAGGQFYLPENELTEFAFEFGIPLTPRLVIDTPLPVSVEETGAWLTSALPTTLVALDSQSKGHPEGIVVRTWDRSRIAKIRNEDYERHLKRSHAR